MSRRASPDVSRLEDALSYHFKDKTLLMRALTHVSSLSSQEGRQSSYQRLEFLGDRVLGLCISDMLLDAFPTAEEGELSRRLADLVRKETCTEVAQMWGAGEYLRLGAGEIYTGGRKNAAILADVCEALVGAIFCDGGYEAVRRVIQKAFQKRMEAPVRPLQDAKTALQEWAQGQGLNPPVYRIIERTGPDHAPHFVISVEMESIASGLGTGMSRRAAEQAAAVTVLKREGVWLDEEKRQKEI